MLLLLHVLRLVELDEILEALGDDVCFLSSDGDEEELGGALGAVAGNEREEGAVEALADGGDGGLGLHEEARELCDVLRDEAVGDGKR